MIAPLYLKRKKKKGGGNVERPTEAQETSARLSSEEN
jgi:hypothetical protein